MITSRMEMCAKGSSTVVTMWATSRQIPNRLKLRCRSTATNPGVSSPLHRVAVRMPSTTVTVSTIKVLTPRPRVAYQYQLGFSAFAAARKTGAITGGLPRPTAGVADAAARTHKTRRQVEAFEPGGRAIAHHQRRRRGGVCFQARGRRHSDHVPRRRCG